LSNYKRKELRANPFKRLYSDQLELSEQHLDHLLRDTTSALDLLASLSEAFKTVESETTAFQAQCEDLLSEQKRLRDLADEIGTDLQYYAYLEPLTRRLNAPGAARLVRNEDFLDMLTNLNTCIEFMDEHVRLIFSLASGYFRADLPARLYYNLINTDNTSLTIVIL